MGKIKFYHVKYKKKKITLIYKSLKGSKGYRAFYNGVLFIWINIDLEYRIRSKVLHKMVK